MSKVPVVGRDRRKMRRVEAGLPAFQIRIAAVRRCGIERERLGVETARCKPRQQRLLERAGAERGARTGPQSEQLSDQRIEMALRAPGSESTELAAISNSGAGASRNWINRQLSHSTMSSSRTRSTRPLLPKSLQAGRRPSGSGGVLIASPSSRHRAFIASMGRLECTFQRYVLARRKISTGRG